LTEQRYFIEHFEAILGQELDLEGQGDVLLRQNVGAYTRPSGFVTSRDIGTTGESTQTCAITDLTDVTGFGRTGADGSAEFLLNDFVCESFGRSSRHVVEHPVNFVATPLSTSPVFLTCRRISVDDGTDVRITVMAWDPTGAPKPNTSFDWRCRVSLKIGVLG